MLMWILLDYTFDCYVCLLGDSTGGEIGGIEEDREGEKERAGCSQQKDREEEPGNKVIR